MAEKNFIVNDDLEVKKGIIVDSGANITGDLSVTGTITGDVPASNLSGTIDSARVPSLATSDVVTGTFDSARIPSLSTADIVTGSIDSARIPSLATSDIVTGTFDSARIPSLAGEDITAGTVSINRLPTIALTTNTSGNYVQSTTAGPGIKPLSAAGEGVAQTISVDSAFVRGRLVAGTGVVYDSVGGVISVGQAISSTDDVLFSNVTSTAQFKIYDSANGQEVAHLEGDTENGLVIHSHAHATDGGIRFVIHDTADSDYLIISQPTGISVVNRTIQDVATPVNDTDAANKAYVDAVSEGLHIHEAARVATVQDLTTDVKVTSVAYDSGTLGVGAFLQITGSLDSIDGIALQTNDRLLIKNQTNSNHNGVYVWDSAQRITRADDFDTDVEVAGGDFIFVIDGTVNASAGFVQTESHVGQVGDSAILFTQFSGAGQITAGDGLSKTGNRLDVDLAGTSGLEITSGELRVDVADVSLEITGSGLRVKQENGGIAVDHLDLDATASGLTAFTLANVRAATSETLTNLTSFEDATYKFYTKARSDSDTLALIDSDYISLKRPPESIFQVVDNGLSSAYVFTGDGFPASTNNPSIALARGKTYKFDVSASGHPFWIQKVSGAYSSGDVLSSDSGVVNNGADDGNIFFTVPMDVDVNTAWYYVCQNHSAMGGSLNFLAAPNEINAYDSALVNQQIDSDFDNHINGTANEVEVTSTGGYVTIGLPASVQITTGLTVGGNSVLTTANEGTGNGLDADTVDGIEGASLLRSDATDAYTSGTLTFNSGTTLTAANGATVNFQGATVPFTVASGTSTVTNLDADKLDGQQGTYYRITVKDSAGTVLNV